MNKKDYIKAAKIVMSIRTSPTPLIGNQDLNQMADGAEIAFVALFRDNPSFDEVKFRQMCKI